MEDVISSMFFIYFKIITKENLDKRKICNIMVLLVNSNLFLSLFFLFKNLKFIGDISWHS